MFQEIQSTPNRLIEKLNELSTQMSMETYYEIRSMFNQKPTVEQFIYLNKRCFRGLYRVNRKGEFNASVSSEKNVVLYDEQNILELNRLFNKFDVKFESKDYLDVEFVEGATMYFDPPYYGMFNEYCSNLFDHIQYVDVLENLRNVKLFHSNSNLFRNVYDNDNCIDIPVRDRINAKKPVEMRMELFYYN
jgi:DNA adenine methylase